MPTHTFPALTEQSLNVINKKHMQHTVSDIRQPG